MDLDRRVIVVTGAASGIGLATAQVLVEEGAHLVLVDHDAPRLETEAEKLQAQSVQMEIYAIDVTHRSAVQEFIADVEGHLSIYGVVNAAGVVQFGTITDVSEDDWNRVLDVNLKGSYIVCQETIPSLMRRGVGAIVNLASVSGRTRSIYAAPNYAASKAGVIGLTMALAAQHASSGIRVNCVAPGVINTPMIAGYSDEQRAAIIESIPLGRIGSSQEVANVIVSLLSERWSYVTGQTINVNGGLFMH